ncbi:sortase [Virgibacillus phasianinus]|uniref:Sortase n=1 Tax=Virgibacillus phasianinus TaxID=2017483 RepID=A0A220TZM4_9BACI|nr:class F sortase [Virgibacillus phasianinus]ASK61277.1 sortase [Virgibacillus phasianinus]
MRKIITILLLTVLVGCGNMHSADSPQPEQKDNQDNTTEKKSVDQPDTEMKSMTMEKKKEEKSFYSDAFAEPIKGIVPDKISIESIGAEASVEKVGLQDNGKMGVPEDYNNAGWYQSGAKPGEQGSAVIAGHVNTPEGEGIFWDLHKLEAGDEVKVTGKSGETRIFEVVDKKAFDLGEAPVEQIFGYTPRKMLNLITCTGEYNYDIGTHNQRLVVYTELKEDSK